MRVVDREYKTGAQKRGGELVMYTEFTDLKWEENLWG